MRDLMEKLRVYGADIRGAMGRFLDDEELYEDCLHTFMTDPSFAALGEALAEGSCEKAFDAAHSLKGVSANLGLEPLYDAVCAVVEPLRAGNSTGLEPLYAKVLAERDRVKALLQEN